MVKTSFVINQYYMAGSERRNCQHPVDYGNNIRGKSQRCMLLAWLSDFLMADALRGGTFNKSDVYVQSNFCLVLV